MSLPLPISIFVFLFGAAFGSFGNVLIYRLPEGRSIGGRSACPHCGRTLNFLDLIPIVSFVVLRARCRSCKAAISWQYPLVEIASGFLFLYAFSQQFSSILPAFTLGFCLWLLLLIAVADARTQTIPDALNIPFLLLSLLHAWFLGSSALLPVAVGGGFFAVQWIASRGKWVGSGDIILAAGIGALLGNIPSLLLSLWIAYVTGACVAVVLLLRKKKTMESQLPFGPFLVWGAFSALFWSDAILMRIFGV